jgi:uncharacterized protein (DUF2235 family)
MAKMGKNIIICSDGTGNTFEKRITNVTRLVWHLDLDQPDRQVVCYDQGVGTTAQRKKAVSRTAASPGHGTALCLLPAPAAGWFPPSNWVSRGRGLLFGDGLEENVSQMYRKLAQLYEGPEDRVFLFGFSRGAFTVRALAGLLYRCHLPRRGQDDIDRRFERAWKLFQPMMADMDAVRDLRRDHRPCPVHFMGLWDTVKSYGGLDPVILPHLRHNPDATHVRHALALDERRAWFKPTTWGQLDIDRDNAMTRLDPHDEAGYEAQDISEVWFTGCHSDIGRGNLTLRWMLGEAVNVQDPVLLSETGASLLRTADLHGTAEITPSWNWGWRMVEKVPRREIDNSGVYPVKVSRRGSDGVRFPEFSRRRRRVTVHASVGNHHSIQGPIDVRSTKGPPASSSTQRISVPLPLPAPSAANPRARSGVRGSPFLVRRATRH